MRRSIRLTAAVIFLFGFLIGCHADVTEQVTANRDGTVTLTYTETMDDEAFQDINRLGGSDPFRETIARSDGWSVAESATAEGHQVTFGKTVPLAMAGAELLRVAQDCRTAPSDGYDFDPWSVIGNARTGTNVAALLRPLSVLQVSGHDPNVRTAQANAIINARIADSIVVVHLVLRGVATPARAWELHFATPTRVAYDGDAVIAGFLNNPQPQVWPLSPVEATWQNVGEFGVFDYERWGEPPCQVNSQYRRATMFGVGVYARGAGIPEQLMENTMEIAESYLLKHPWECLTGT